MIEPLRQNLKALDVEPGDIVVTKDGTRRCLILKKEMRHGTNRGGLRWDKNVLPTTICVGV